MIPPCSLEICNDSDYLLKEILNIRSNYEITDIRIIKNIQTKPSQALPSFILAHFTCTKPHPMTQNQYSNPLEISVIAGGPWQRAKNPTYGAAVTPSFTNLAMVDSQKLSPTSAMADIWNTIGDIN